MGKAGGTGLAGGKTDTFEEDAISKRSKLSKKGADGQSIGGRTEQGGIEEDAISKGSKRSKRSKKGDDGQSIEGEDGEEDDDLVEGGEDDEETRKKGLSCRANAAAAALDKDGEIAALKKTLAVILFI